MSIRSRRAWPTPSSICRETWNIPNPQDDEQLNLGTAALRAFLERFPKHDNAGRAIWKSPRAISTAAGRRRRGRVEAVPGRSPLPRLQGNAGGPEPAGPRLSIAEGLYPGPGRVAGIPGQVPGPQGLERGAAGDRGDRIPDGLRPVRGQEIRRGQQALRRVPGQISAWTAATPRSCC